MDRSEKAYKVVDPTRFSNAVDGDGRRDDDKDVLGSERKGPSDAVGRRSVQIARRDADDQSGQIKRRGETDATRRAKTRRRCSVLRSTTFSDT